MEAKTTEINELEHGNLLFGRIKPEDNTDLSQLGRFDALIIDDGPERHLYNFICRLRMYQQFSISLMPVLLYSFTGESSNLAGIFDGELTALTELDHYAPVVSRITKTLDKLSKQYVPAETKIYKTALVEKDSSSLKTISSLIDAHPNFEVVSTCGSIKEVNELISLNNSVDKNVDVLFGDFDFSEQADTDVLNKIQDSSILDVIAISEDERQALHAFDYSVTDYLLKPISDKKVNRAFNQLSKKYQYPERDRQSADDILLTKILAYIRSRPKDSFKPVQTALSSHGYTYPMLTTDSDPSLVQDQLEILGFAAKNRFVETTYDDVIYLCRNCSGGLHHYRESCPNCESSHLREEDLIHHFRCAYVGPESDFRQQEFSPDLTCPKCSRKLKHIGVDYDKPSAVFNCHSCESVFQDPVIRAKCISCGQDDPVEYLVKHELFTYNITGKGIEVVEGKRVPHVQKEGPSFEETHFYQFLINEIDKKSNRPFESNIASFHFHNLDKLFSALGAEKSQAVRKELYKMINTGLPSQTVTDFRDPYQPLLIIREENTNKSKEMLSGIKFQLNEFLQDSLDGFKPEISFEVLPVSRGMSARQHLEALNKRKSNRS